MVSNDSNSKQTYNIMIVRPNGLCSCNITNAITSSSSRADGYPVLYPMVPELSNGMKNIHMACARVHPFLISALRHVVRISSVRSTLINRSSAGDVRAQPRDEHVDLNSSKSAAKQLNSVLIKTKVSILS